MSPETTGALGVAIDWRDGAAENIPFAPNSFDVVIGQLDHMFAPRPDVVTAQMLKVLKPGGTIAFSTWPPELFIGRSFALTSSYMPPPPLERRRHRSEGIRT